MYKKEYGTRHYDIIPQEAYAARIVIIGAGAVGSFTAMTLAKMGWQNLTVYDFDTVETENVGSQFYPPDMVGKKKVEALQDLIHWFTGVKIEAIDARVDKGTKIDCDILITAVDNMAARELVFNNPVNIRTSWLIDPRMSAEYASMYVVDQSNPIDRSSYSRSLYTDESAVQERCTAKATMYTVLLLSGSVCKVVKDILGKNRATGNMIRSYDWDIGANRLMAFNMEGERL